MKPHSYSVSMGDGRRYVDFDMTDNFNPEQVTQYLTFRIQLPPEAEQPFVQVALADAIMKAQELLQAEITKLRRGDLYIIGQTKEPS